MEPAAVQKGDPQPWKQPGRFKVCRGSHIETISAPPCVWYISPTVKIKNKKASYSLTSCTQSWGPSTPRSCTSWASWPGWSAPGLWRSSSSPCRRGARTTSVSAAFPAGWTAAWTASEGGSSTQQFTVVEMIETTPRSLVRDQRHTRCYWVFYETTKVTPAALTSTEEWIGNRKYTRRCGRWCDTLVCSGVFSICSILGPGCFAPNFH